MSRINEYEVIQSLRAVALEAAAFYSDKPKDYKVRRVTPDGVIGVGKSPHYMDVVKASVENTSGRKILDVGIAYGIYDEVLKRDFDFEVYGIDHPDNISAYCRYPIHQGIPVLPCDLHFDSIPFPEKMFDTVIASEIVEHLFVSAKGFFAKLYPVLKPGGKLIVTTPNFASLRNILFLIKGINPAGIFPDEAQEYDGRVQDSRVHLREYTVQEIETALVAAGFEIFSSLTKTYDAEKEIRLHSRMLNRLMRIIPKRGENIVVIGTRKSTKDFFSERGNRRFF